MLKKAFILILLGSILVSAACSRKTVVTHDAVVGKTLRFTTLQGSHRFAMFAGASFSIHFSPEAVGKFVGKDVKSQQSFEGNYRFQKNKEDKILLMFMRHQEPSAKGLSYNMRLNFADNTFTINGTNQDPHAKTLGIFKVMPNKK